MAGDLASCSGCKRHVKTTDEACPFCGAAVSAEMIAAASGRRPLARGLSRAALLLASAAAVGACGKEAKTGDTGGVLAPYGAPPTILDAAPPIHAPDAAETTDATADGGTRN